LTARWAHIPTRVGTEVRILPPQLRSSANAAFFMFYIYLIYSQSADKHYIGFTSSLSARLDAHNHPQNKGWTKSFKPWVLVYSEEFETKPEAMKREKYLKSIKNKEYLLELISKKTD
jgi:putative endonuclease